MWDTEYLHALPSPEAIVEGMRGTGLRPWIEELDDGPERARVLKECEREIASRYPMRAHRKALFPFPRRFVIAYR